MLLDTLSIPTDSLQATLDESIFKGDNFWIFLSSLQFIIILYLLFIRNRKMPIWEESEMTEILKSSKSTSIDMDNLMNSINMSRSLYKVLSRECHPDNFINSSKEQIANDIFQEVSRNKRDYGKLKELAERAKKELDLTINHR